MEGMEIEVVGGREEVVDIAVSVAISGLFLDGKKGGRSCRGFCSSAQ